MIRYLAFAALATGAWGQSFEVASIRIKPFEQVMREAAAGAALGIEIGPDRVHIAAMHLAQLISAAYNLKDYQIEGPDWLVKPPSLTMFEIEAKLPAGATRDQVPMMLQNLLKDRFKLVIRKGSKTLDTYALTVGKNGPNFKAKEAPDPPQTTTTVTRGERGETAIVTNGTKETISPGRGSRVETSTIGGLIDYVSTRLAMPVVDKTGLTGTFEITLQIPASGAPTDPKQLVALLQDNPDLLSEPLVSAVERLGLKLERQKNLIETIVIEHAERTPTEN